MATEENPPEGSGEAAEPKPSPRRRPSSVRGKGQTLPKGGSLIPQPRPAELAEARRQRESTWKHACERYENLYMSRQSCGEALEGLAHTLQSMDATWGDNELRETVRDTLESVCKALKRLCDEDDGPPPTPGQPGG